MITFCIPIYNQDVNNLVDKIINQAEAIDLTFQILCFDDMSDDSFKEINSKLGLKLNVSYTELSENIGRARIRNKMAKFARYDWMVFLDGDSEIISDDFVQNYAEIKGKQSVVYGGRIYAPKSPGKAFSLHYNYGRKVESVPVQKRLNNRYSTFLSNNFMVTARVMSRYPFDEGLSSYGYEDLEWAERLKANNIMIHHIDNPIVHLGIDNNQSFVEKTELGIQNLVNLYKEKKISSSRLIRFYHRIKSFGLLEFYKAWFSKNQNSLKRGLAKGSKGLLHLQAFKLGLFAYYLEQ